MAVHHWYVRQVGDFVEVSLQFAGPKTEGGKVIITTTTVRMDDREATEFKRALTKTIKAVKKSGVE